MGVIVALYSKFCTKLKEIATYYWEASVLSS